MKNHLKLFGKVQASILARKAITNVKSSTGNIDTFFLSKQLTRGGLGHNGGVNFLHWDKQRIL